MVHIQYRRLRLGEERRNETKMDRRRRRRRNHRAKI